MPETDPSLEPFFSPAGVAVVGASHDPTKLGYGLSRNLVQSGYRGAIHFVNIHNGSLMGRPVYPNLAEVPDPVDLAVLLIPAAGIPEALRECARRGIHAAIIAAGGFRETGSDGAALEAECLKLAREHGLRLLGPNCIGLLDTHLPLDTTFLSPPGPTPGDVAFVSHSGAICAAVIDWARGQGFGLSRLVSLGNQADVNETDMLVQVSTDPYTHVLTLYLEGVSDGRRFVEQARRVSLEKPVVALKVGRFESSQRAVASHTGALAGSEDAFNAAFRRAGVIRAETTEELFDWARALAWCPLPGGRSVAVLTNAGGPGVTAVDSLETHGLRLAQLSVETQASLKEMLPPAASLTNPVDMLAGASPQQYAACLRILLGAPEVDSAMVILPPPPMHTAGGIAKAIIPVIFTSQKPVVVALMGERLIQEAVEHFRAAHVPEYRFPERAATALAILAQRAEYLTAERTGQADAIQWLEGMKREAVGVFLEGREPGWLSQEQVFQVLAAYGIPTLQIRLAASAAQAANLAGEMGYPVVLKIAAPQVAHKSDYGGVLLDLRDRRAVVNGYKTVVDNSRKAWPGAENEGVYVQRMVAEGQEVIIGAIQDADFGPVVMFGSGGVEVEGLKDVQFSLAPPSREETEAMLENTWAGKKLHGYRNLPPADRPAVKDALLRLAQLAVDFPQLAEIEINPLRVLEEGMGAVAIDARARLGR